MGRPFEYQPLDKGPGSQHIRLLKLLPAKFLTDIIRCKIFHASLAEQHSKGVVYEALSYVWGSEESLSSIFLEYINPDVASGLQSTQVPDTDQDFWHPFSVTQNLAAALRCIRKTDSERIVWIDAICINQKDLDEKAHQVGRMRDIYLATTQVIVWLGELQHAEITLDFLSRLPTDANGNIDYVYDKKDAPQWDACSDLFYKTPWWSRSWILQEVLHNRDVIVYIGKIQRSIDDLLAAFYKFYWVMLAMESIATSRRRDQQVLAHTAESKKNLLYDSWFRTGATAEDVADVIARMRPQFKGPPFERPRLGGLLYKFRDQKATEPKDKIYSLLGLAKQEYSIPIDYKRSKRDIYTITARHLLSRILLVLLWVESPQRDIKPGVGQELPSWVPDFTQEQYLIPRCMHSTYNYFGADDNFPGGLKKVDPSTPDDWGILTLRGVYVASITSICTTSVTKEWSSDPKWKEFDRVKLIQYDRNLSVRDSPVQRDSWPVGENGVSSVAFDNTSWGPLKAEPGDIIIVSAGSRLPLVLRRHGGMYLFVGACWLIDHKLDDLTKLSDLNQLNSTSKAEKDPGFSPVMFGSIIEEIGKTCNVEEFPLC